MTSIAAELPRPDPRTYETLALHALAWLVLGSAVGVTMSLLLVSPDAGRALGPVTFGRLAPLHLDLLLYGWGALPLVGLLLALYHGGPSGSRWPVAAIHVWSASLVLGAGSWLLGDTNGKLFLDWSGPARAGFLLALAFLAVALARGLVAEWRRTDGARHRLKGKLALLLALCLVPAAMLAATDARTYPPIDTSSGGPTGASLLGSTLGIVWVMIAVPWALGLSARTAATRRIVVRLSVHTLGYLLIAGGDHTNHEMLQIAAVLSILPWTVWLPRWLLSRSWPPAARPWLVAFLAWGAALVASGIVAFLPGVLIHVKFTNVLVGHAHVAMAGMWSSFGVAVLVVLLRETSLGSVFSERRAFALWHAGGVAHVLALAAVGAAEWTDPGILFRPDVRVSLLYAVRAAAGVAMLAAALTWWRDALRRAVG